MEDCTDFERQLLARAIEVRERAYAPYSNYSVGAAILSREDKIFCGCNVENSSYGLTVCAERNAIAAMISAGFEEIRAIAVALEGAGSPCGACRQVLSEFGSQFPVLIVDVSRRETVRRFNFKELFPVAFQLPNKFID